MNTLLIDADDTLWENIVVFNEINRRYVNWLLPTRTVADLQPELDALQVECIERLGYGRDTFETSLVEGVARFTDSVATVADKAFITELVRPLQWDTLDVLDGVVETLDALSARATLIMVTKGDHGEQQQKVDRSGLASFFSAVEILETKSSSEYQRIVTDHGLEIATTWMVGNSPRSDIAPALELGLGAVFIPHAHTWSHEQAGVDPHPRLIQLASFGELTDRF